MHLPNLLSGGAPAKVSGNEDSLFPSLPGFVSVDVIEILFWCKQHLVVLPASCRVKCCHYGGKRGKTL